MNCFKSLLLILVITSLLPACSHEHSGEDSSLQPDSSVDHSVSADQNERSFPKIILTETHLDTFELPFPQKDMFPTLRDHYSNLEVIQGIGEQDGPGFRYIDLFRSDTLMLSFNFNPDDSNLLDEVVILGPLASDEYGLRIGDSFSAIAERRNESLRNYTDYHFHTYVFADNSHIYYEVINDSEEEEAQLDSSFDDTDNAELSEIELRDWKIERIIWSRLFPGESY